MSERSAVIVGAGLSGLSAAYRLQQAGVAVEVLERAPSAPAGRAYSTRRDGFLLDRGADALVDGYVDYFRLAREVGLEQDLCPVTAPVGTIRDGRVINVQGSASSLLRTDLLSWRAKLRFFAGMAQLHRRIKGTDTAVLHQLADIDDCSAQDFGRRLFGQEATDYLIEPMIRMLNGSDAADASAVDVVGDLALGYGTPHALRGGVGALPEALQAKVAVSYGVEAVEVREGISGVEVDVRGADGASKTLKADGCVLATMLEPAASLYRPVYEATREMRAELSYIKLFKIQLGFSTRTRCEAFMVQSPRVEDGELMGMFLDHNKCSDRAPDGHSLLSVYTDTRTSERFSGRSEDELVDWAYDKAITLFPELDGRLLFGVVTRWPLMGISNAPGSYRRAAAALARLDANSRVQAGGDWFTKTSQGAAVAAGERSSRALLRVLAS